MQPQFATVATPARLWFAARSPWKLVTPAAPFLLHSLLDLEPIRDVLFSTIQGDSAEPDHRWVKLLTQQIQSAEVNLVAELAHAPATVEQCWLSSQAISIELDLEKSFRPKSMECRFSTAITATRTGATR